MTYKVINTNGHTELLNKKQTKQRVEWMRENDKILVEKVSEEDFIKVVYSQS